MKKLTQEEIILKLFKTWPDREFTPFEVAQRVRRYLRAPITSIRRAITNLTDGGYLKKLSLTREGYFGRPNTCWKIARKDGRRVAVV